MNSRLEESNFCSAMQVRMDGVGRRWTLLGLGMLLMVVSCAKESEQAAFSSAKAVGHWRSERESEGLLFKTRWHYEFEIEEFRGQPRIKGEIRKIYEQSRREASRSVHHFSMGMLGIFALLGSGGGPPEIAFKQSWDPRARTLEITRIETLGSTKASIQRYRLRFVTSEGAILTVEGNRLICFRPAAVPSGRLCAKPRKLFVSSENQ